MAAGALPLDDLPGRYLATQGPVDRGPWVECRLTIRKPADGAGMRFELMLTDNPFCCDTETFLGACALEAGALVLRSSRRETRYFAPVMDDPIESDEPSTAEFRLTLPASREAEMAAALGERIGLALEWKGWKLVLERLKV